jgi:hypothetical protein
MAGYADQTAGDMAGHISAILPLELDAALRCLLLLGKRFLNEHRRYIQPYAEQHLADGKSTDRKRAYRGDGRAESSHHRANGDTDKRHGFS